MLLLATLHNYMKKHYLSCVVPLRNANLTVMFRDTGGVYFENNTKHVNSLHGKMHSFLTLQQLIYIITKTFEASLFMQSV